MHHICTSYALGAAPEVIRKNYDKNLSYQRPPPSLRDYLAQELHDPKVFIANLHKGNFYPDYMTFIAREIEKQGYENGARKVHPSTVQPYRVDAWRPLKLNPWERGLRPEYPSFKG